MPVAQPNALRSVTMNGQPATIYAPTTIQVNGNAIAGSSVNAMVNTAIGQLGRHGVRDLNSF